MIRSVKEGKRPMEETNFGKEYFEKEGNNRKKEVARCIKGSTVYRR